MKFNSRFQAILVGGLCPGQENPAACEESLPEFWNMIAALLWPGYWDPTVSNIYNLDDSHFQNVFHPGRVDVR